MTEPTYTYVRGTGWVPVAGIETYTVERYGKRITATIRRPLPGESYYYNTPDKWGRQWRDANDNFILPAFVEFLVERDVKRGTHLGCTWREDLRKPHNAIFVVFTTENL